MCSDMELCLSAMFTIFEDRFIYISFKYRAPKQKYTRAKSSGQLVEKVFIFKALSQQMVDF